MVSAATVRGMVEELVHHHLNNGIATVTLDSPRNRNALSTQLRRELLAQLDTAISEEATRVIVLDHTGPVFCAGMDLKESRSPGPGDGPRDQDAPKDQRDQGAWEFPEILERIWRSPKPVVAKLAGPARAGGVGLVAAADIAVAVEDATFAFSEVRIGVLPAMISVTVLPRLHARQAHELFLTGESFDAHRAVSIGLLNSAVTTDELDAEVARYTGMLSRGGPHALAATKEMLRHRNAPSMHEDFGAMLALSETHFASQEGQEGIRAFAEKRKPAWTPGSDV